MAGAIIGALRVVLGIDSAQFDSGLSDAQRKLGKASKSMQDTGAQMAKVGAVLTVGITAPFVALVSSAIPAAVESQQAMAQVNAALASMGPIAGRTADQLSALAGKLQDTSNFDDDDIMKSVTANLLTFGKVQGEVFDRAEQAAVNLSARLGQDLQASAIQLGKALNDPIKGVTALQRVGVSFTAAQKEQIKSMVEAGNVAGAQGIILGELEKQFGGAAQAQRDATPTAAQDQAWRTFQENVGGAALKVMPAFTSAATGILDAFNSLSPSVQTTVIVVGALAAALGPVLAGMGAVVTLIGAAIPVIASLGAAITTTAVPAIIAFGAVMLPVLAPIAAVAGAIALVVAAVRHWDEIKAVTARVVSYMGDMVTGVKDWLVGKLVGVLQSISAPIKKVGDWFFNLYDRVVGHSYVPDMVDEIGDEMRRLDGEMVNPAKDATDATAAAFLGLQRRVGPILDRLFPDQAKMNQYKADLADLEEFGLKAGWSPDQVSEARRRLLADASGGILDRPDTNFEDPQISVRAPKAEMDDLSASLGKVLGSVDDTNKKLKVSFADMARDITGSLRGLVTTIKSGDWLGALSGILDIVSQVSGFLKGTGTPAVRTYPIGIEGARATGGPVVGGKPYLVGEKGMEIFTPQQSGYITANKDLNRGSPVPLVISVEEGALFRPVIRSESGAVASAGMTMVGRKQAWRARQSLA